MFATVGTVVRRLCTTLERQDKLKKINKTQTFNNKKKTSKTTMKFNATVFVAAAIIGFATPRIVVADDAVS